MTGGTYSGAPGAFFLQTVFWPTEVGGNASIGCCASTSPGDADAQGLNELLSEIHDFSSRHNPKGRVPRCSGCRRDEPPITTRPRRSAPHSRRRIAGYNTRLPPRFFAHIRAKLLRAHLRSGLNLVPCAE